MATCQRVTWVPEIRVGCFWTNWKSIVMSTKTGPSMLEDGMADTTPYPLGLTVSHAEGIWIHLDDGRRLADLISGIGVSSFGHAHPEINDAIHAQVDQHLHTMVYGEFRQQAQLEASQQLFNLLPDSLDAVYYVNSGAEAIEGAIKLARRTTGRKRILSVRGGYHGNTAGALAVSGNEARKAPFLPLLPEVGFLDWNVMDVFDSIDASCAAVLVETIQGDAGVRIPSQIWLQTLRERCTEVGAMLILDEIQCGMGRTGLPFAFEHFGIEPDMLCLGNALGGGMPMGAFVSSKSHMRKLSMQPKLGHITTFGGHPVSCAASAVACQLVSNLDAQAIERKGQMMEDALIQMPFVQAVRRMGLFIAVDLDEPARVQAAVDRCLNEELLIFYFLSVPASFRLAPPLTISEDEVVWAMNRLHGVLKSLHD